MWDDALGSAVCLDAVSFSAARAHHNMQDSLVQPPYPLHTQVYTKKKQTSASLDTLMRTGRGELLDKMRGDEFTFLDEHHPTDQVLMQVACFLRKDLPIRLAHRILDLDQVPSMRDMPSVQKVKNVYIESFQALTSFPKFALPIERSSLQPCWKIYTPNIQMY